MTSSHTTSEVCCNAWRQAQQSGTDNEMYGALLYRVGKSWHMGSDLPDVEYCPWCGAHKSDGEQNHVG